jgi:hypothetical protein
VSDLVDGLVKLMNANFTYPINIGNPDEYTVKFGYCYSPLFKNRSVWLIWFDGV